MSRRTVHLHIARVVLPAGTHGSPAAIAAALGSELQRLVQASPSRLDLGSRNVPSLKAGVLPGEPGGKPIGLGTRLAGQVFESLATPAKPGNTHG